MWKLSVYVLQSDWDRTLGFFSSIDRFEIMGRNTGQVQFTSGEGLPGREAGV